MNRVVFCVALLVTFNSAGLAQAQDTVRKDQEKIERAVKKQLEINYPNDTEERQGILNSWRLRNGLMTAAQSQAEQILATRDVEEDPRVRSGLTMDMCGSMDVLEKIRMGTAPVQREIIRLITPLPSKGSEQSSTRPVVENLVPPNGNELTEVFWSPDWNLERAYRERQKRVLDEIAERGLQQARRDFNAEEARKFAASMARPHSAGQTDTNPEVQIGLAKSLLAEYRRASAIKSETRTDPTAGSSASRLRDLLKRLGGAPPVNGIEKPLPRPTEPPKKILN